MPPKFNFFFYLPFLELGNLIGPSLKKSEIMVASQNRKFYFEVQSSSPLAKLCRGKEDNNLLKHIWDKSEVLWREHVGEHFWEPNGNPLRT